MRSKRRRRPVHYTAFAFHDGAAVACSPHRKPSKKKLKEDGDRIDEDFVYREYYYTPQSVYEWSDELRVRFADLLANRLNMRRAVREIAVPHLEAIQTQLLALTKRLERIERALAKST
jgi:hypothetical protein